MKATTKELVDWFVEIGCRLKQGAKHMKVFAPDGRMIYVFSDKRSKGTNDVAAIKRHVLRKLAA